jgi:heme/copper-type cytochrome/quinol oxidase subunit 2
VDGGVQTKDVPLGSTVTLKVTSDVADEVHVHGYDKKGDVEAGSSVTITFTADLPGQFEVELEDAHLKLVELRVS